MTAYESITLGAKYTLRIEDLASSDALQVSCLTCEHKAMITADALAARWPARTRIIDIERHFACTRCGNREGNLWSTMREAII